MKQVRAIDVFEAYNPCYAARIWFGDKSIREAWRTCEKASWMMWGIRYLGMGNDSATKMAAIRCAQLVVHLIPKRERRPRIALRSARLCCKGLLPFRELKAHIDATAEAATQHHSVACVAVLWAITAVYCPTSSSALMGTALIVIDTLGNERSTDLRMCQIIRRTIKERDVVAAARNRICSLNSMKQQ